jgi:hypothetical protein
VYVKRVKVVWKKSRKTTACELRSLIIKKYDCNITALTQPVQIRRG